MTLTASALSDTRFHFHPYTQPRQLERDGPLVITRGEGVYVYGEDGKKYLEAMAGLWCASLGFDEKELVDAAIKQMRELPYYHGFGHKSTLPSIDLAERLKAMAPAPFSKVLFVNSGSEANDTQISCSGTTTTPAARLARRR